MLYTQADLKYKKYTFNAFLSNIRTNPQLIKKVRKYTYIRI